MATEEKVVPPVLPPQILLYQMATAHSLPPALRVVATLGIADLLKDGPRHARELAEASSTRAASLTSTSSTTGTTHAPSRSCATVIARWDRGAGSSSWKASIHGASTSRPRAGAPPPTTSTCSSTPAVASARRLSSAPSTAPPASRSPASCRPAGLARLLPARAGLPAGADPARWLHTLRLGLRPPRPEPALGSSRGPPDPDRSQGAAGARRGDRAGGGRRGGAVPACDGAAVAAGRGTAATAVGPDRFSGFRSRRILLACDLAP